MWFWWYMLGLNLLICAALAGGGLLMWKRTPSKINAWVGYRTERSTKNAETWRFANEYAGRRIFKTGLAFIVPSALALLPVYGRPDGAACAVGLIAASLQLVFLLAAIPATEKALRAAFNDDGTRRGDVPG